MYIINYINHLNYKFDGEFFQDVEQINIIPLYYRINELGQFPFIELYIANNGGIFSQEKKYVHNNNFNNIINYFGLKFPEENKSVRFQGFKKKESELHLFYRVNFNDYIKEKYYCNKNGFWCSYDDFSKKFFFKINISESMYDLCYLHKELFIIQNLKNNEIYKVPYTYYSYVNDSEYNKNYINNNLSLFLIDNKLKCVLKKKESLFIKNIIFDKKIKFYNQIISYYY